MKSETPTHAPAIPQLEALRAHLDAQIVTPTDEHWDDARRAWNLAVDQRPAAVAFPVTAGHVVALVEFAREHGLRVAAQGTGHNAAAIESLDGTLLLKTERMRNVRIDPEACIARVEAGALWQDVTGPAGEHGLAGLAGSSPDVGVVGYTLGGGLSWMARRHGLASNSVTAIEIVTADGRLVRTDPSNEPDLFWALRGGGGSFGVVTAIEFRLYPIAQVHAGMLAFPIERASDVLHAWREWTRDVPDEVTSVGRLLRVPPLPEIPEAVRGRELVVIEATILDGDHDTDELLEPLRALGAEMDTFGNIPVSALHHLHMDPDHPVPGMGTHMLLGDLPAEAIDALVEVGGPGTRTPLLSIELRHLGGAVGRAEAGHGAVAAIDAPFAMFGVGMAMTPEMIAGIEAYRPELRAALAPYDAGHAYSNFVEEPTHASRMFARDSYARLCEVKADYDPADLFRSNHPIPAAR
jgi:UDP-N-acetylenolpyruvoylglucosamine reductase